MKICFKKGFTLIEITIVIIIIAIILSNLLIYTSSSVNQATVRMLNVLNDNKIVNGSFLMKGDKITVCQLTLTGDDTNSFNISEKNCFIQKDLLWNFDKQGNKIYKIYNIFVDKDGKPIKNFQNKYIHIKNGVLENFSFNL